MSSAVVVIAVALVVVFAVAAVILGLRAKKAGASLAECETALASYSEIQAAAQDIEKLHETKKKLEGTIRQYQSIVGGFKSAAKLQQHIRKLQAVVGPYKTLAELQAKVDEQRDQLQQFTEALDVSANAEEIISKAKYYENLVQQLQADVESLEETKDLQTFGFYRPQYDFEHSNEYKKALDEIVNQRKQAIKAKAAVEVPPGITVDGDERAGKKLGDEYARVMLRAFNGEADASIAKARYNNMQILQKRMEKSREQINKLGTTMGISIAPPYLELRLKELRLAYESERKKQQEREEQAYLRELAREEEKARREAEKAKREAEKLEEEERQRLTEKESMLAELKKQFEDRRMTLEHDAALSQEQQAQLRAQMIEQEQEINNLESQRDTLITAVQEAHERRERAISLAEMTKRGYVYILSNIGSFRDNWFKIGMTRREDPNQRIKELASASVPFPFDVHAMILTNDAPALENALHVHFADRRVNKVNSRKEFFEVTIEEIESALDEVCSSPIEFRAIAEAAEYRETEAIRKEEQPHLFTDDFVRRSQASSVN